MIELKNVSKSYGGKVKAVDNVTLTIEPGSVYGFLGPNGAGKTTTIKLITGVLQADKGSIVVSGYDIEAADLEAKKRIGFVPDSANAFLSLTGLEYLNFMADMYEVSEDDRRTRIDRLSKLLSMDQTLDDKLLSYSHGMRQKIVIIASLLHDPPVWILDEPMSGLDPKSARILKRLMGEHAQAGNSVFFSTHVLEVAENVCDKIAVIDKAKILYAGDLSEMKETADESLESIFLEMTNDE
jgi:ABC-2 type transport system ATP-binding protein